MKSNYTYLNLATSSKNRRNHDFYPTPEDVTVSLMEILHLPIPSKILEPACGNGMMSKVLERYGHMVDSYDIRNDSGYGIGGVDYLSRDFKGYDAIITNPPFNQSMEFITKALSEAKLVAMLLKSQYWHSKKRYSLFINSRSAYIFPLTWRPNFDETKGNSPTMEVYWTVWIQGVNRTEYLPLLKPKV